MNHITNFAESFMKLFQLGGETFISWKWRTRKTERTKVSTLVTVGDGP